MHPTAQEWAGESKEPLRLWTEADEEVSSVQTCPLPVPQTARHLSDHYDLTISRPRADMETFAAFDRWLAAAASDRGLSCCLLTDNVVREAIERLRTGQLKVGFHLDYFALWHVPEDPYAMLAQTVFDRGGFTINPPSRARFFTNKANAHGQLRRQRLGVPQTILTAPDEELDEAALQQSGFLDGKTTVYVKPANGFGSRGVLRIESCDIYRLRTSFREVRSLFPRDAILIQRCVPCPRLRAADGVERWAYWRIAYCLGEAIPFWWCKSEADHGRPSYKRLSAADIKQLRLQDLLTYCRDLAELSGMRWFTSEICASENSELSRYQVPGPSGKTLPLVAIDYMNDQCDVDVLSRWPGGPPDAFVRHVAERFAEEARARKNCLPFPSRRPGVVRAA